jgi:hypothetical protein
MVQPLAWPLVQEHGFSVLARRFEAHGLVPARDVDEAKVFVVPLPDRLVRHLERIMQKRSHRHDRTSECPEFGSTWQKSNGDSLLVRRLCRRNPVL